MTNVTLSILKRTEIMAARKFPGALRERIASNCLVKKFAFPVKVCMSEYIWFNMINQMAKMNLS